MLRCSLTKRILKEVLGVLLPFICHVSFGFVSWVLVLEVVLARVCVLFFGILVFDLGGRSEERRVGKECQP